MAVEARLSRRDFLRAAGLSATAIAVGSKASADVGAQLEMTGRPHRRLFPTDLPDCQWVNLQAEGFSCPAVGVIYRGRAKEPFVPGHAQAPPPVPEYAGGMPLGGIGTGNINLNLDGTLGEWTIYNNLVNPHVLGDRPHYVPLVPIAWDVDSPFLGLSMDGKTCVLAQCQIEAVGTAQKVHYWGHYPVADLEYELDAPVSVGMRAWASFLPGDALYSNIPGAVFEVHLRNLSDSPHRGTLAISFPGPAEYETLGKVNWQRRVTGGEFSGVVMTCLQPDQIVGGDPLHGRSMPFGYALGVVGPARLRAGGPLGASGAAWTEITKSLPKVDPDEPGACIAVDFMLKPKETKIVHFVLAWFAPFWPATPYVNKYWSRFRSPLDVAKLLAREHESLLDRVLAWQEVIYAEEKLPECLRDALVNRLYLMTAGSSYVVRSGKDTDNGLLSIMEAAGSVPLQETMICAWWGNWPALYFFPELRHTTLRYVASLQSDDGKAPFWLGNENSRFDTPKYTEQYVVNALFYTQMVYGLYQRMQDDRVVGEFYPSVKRAMKFEMTLDHYQNGRVSLDPKSPAGHTWDGWRWYGNATYIEGHWLCSLRAAERMAKKAGDLEFSRECRDWINRASSSLEQTLWSEKAQSYVLWNVPGSGNRSDTILVAQFEGEYGCDLLGLPGAFRADRISGALATMKRLCVEPFPAGIPCGVRPDGTVDPEGMGFWIWPQCNELLAATYARHGDRDLAEKLLKTTLENMVLKHQLSWDFPCAFLSPDGSQPYVPDYYNGMAIWAVPPALLGEDLQQFCARGGLVDRVMQAAKKQRHPKGNKFGVQEAKSG